MSTYGKANYGTVRCIAALGALALASIAATAAEPLNVKVGLWEMSTTAATNGPMIPPALLAQMSAEQRARVEAAMKQHAAGGGHASSNSCVTREDLNRGRFEAGKGEDSGNCQYRVETQTATHLASSFKCTGDAARSGEMKIEALSPEQIKGAIQVSTANGKVTVELAGHWLAASCAGADH